MKDGSRAWTWNLIVFVKENGLEIPRLGLAVGRKVGNAVSRNRWKRLTREIFRNTLKAELAGKDIVVAVKAVPGFDRGAGGRPTGRNRAAGRNRGEKAGGGSGGRPVKRDIPAITDLEGELVDALRWIRKKSAERNSSNDSDRSVEIL